MSARSWVSRLRVAGASFGVAGIATILMATGSIAVSLPTSTGEPTSVTAAEPEAPVLQPGDTLTVEEAGGPPPALPLPSLQVQESRLAGQPRVTIPALGASLRMVPSGSTSTAMVVPGGLDRIGWLTSTAAPGAKRGTTLLATHRDGRTARSPFYDLMRLRRGARIVLHDFGGDRHVFKVVSRPTSYDRAALPGGLFAPYGPRRLAITTCGGPYEVGRDGHLHWQRNAVVIAVPAGRSGR